MRRTLEDIIPPSRRRAMAQEKNIEQEEDKPRRSRAPRSHRISYKPAFIAIVIIIAAIGALYFFSGARVQIDPMTNTAPLTLTLTAYASTTSALPFAIVTIEKIASQEVTSSGTKNISKIAHGTLTIYNTLTHTQKLIKNTRFASPNGLIFRIHSAVTVSAAHGIIPGSVIMPIYADAVGSKYNVSPSPFSIPGLVGTPLENKVYAKSTSTMTGGYSGAQPTVSTKIAASARTALRSALVGDLSQSIKQQVPSDYILLSGAATTTFSAAPSKASSTNKALVREDGVMSAIIFPRTALAKVIESHLMGSYTGQPVTIISPNTITFTSLNGFPSKNTQALNFTLSGNVSIVWIVNSIRIASAIADKTRSEANDIMSTFPSVKRASLTLRPFWASTFPSDPTKINIIINKPITSS